ncbi:hypothetical protein [Alkalicoccobacillus porphyridii]|uniref:Uncharacterized protein n=1 Tax=Alkalicoccobacillus porphyridii TaxID=2597270 RepID=A0A554A4C2_9BACI|nr:hypothetical protein [Alkalicoccobacillus porphyridii]TSB48544.1 hypothetical protein FN960_03040 [Alkalicoccobacillus porphyridii]
MKKKILILLLSLLFLVGGFFIVRSLTQTGVTALDDSFTREFLDENVEVGKGFYFYEARNGNYTMWFPEDFYIEGDPAQFESKDHFELIHSYYEEENPEGISKSLQFNYDGDSNQTLQSMDRFLDRLLKEFSYEGQYEKKELDNKVLYFGSSYVELEDKKLMHYEANGNANNYFALIHNQDGTKAVSVRYSIFCSDEKKSCSLEQENEDNFFRRLIESISF